MSRSLPSVLANNAPSRLPRDSDKPLFDLTIQVVTPIFGGGAKAGVPDGLAPIRGSSIRGQLRFWWRACNAHLHPDAASLFEAESKLWGQTSKNDSTIKAPSSIVIEVDEQIAGNVVPPNSPGYPAYALFPFRGQDGRPDINGRSGVSFNLRVSLAHHVRDIDRDLYKKEVEAALWAWITFGGFGARTRRGCGSLWCDNSEFHPESVETVQSWVTEKMARHVAPSDPAVAVRHHSPRLRGGNLIVKESGQTAIAAWGTSISVMKEFRQWKTTSQSDWPEADSIREIARTHSFGHDPKHPARQYFPRAEYGMPIIFHFKDRHSGDPSDHALQPRLDGVSRMASPFILKPLMVTQQVGVPIVLLLKCPFVSSAALKVPVMLNGTEVAPADIQNTSKSQDVPPLASTGATNARIALARFAINQWNPNARNVQL